MSASHRVRLEVHTDAPISLQVTPPVRLVPTRGNIHICTAVKTANNSESLLFPVSTITQLEPHAVTSNLTFTYLILTNLLSGIHDAAVNSTIRGDS